MRLGYKLLISAALIIAVLIPITLIRGVVQDRQRYQAEAVREVEASTAGPQLLQGPVLVVPYTDRRTEVSTDSKGVAHENERVEHCEWLYFPQDLDIRGTMTPTPRRLGLYEVRLYEVATVLRGKFKVEVPAPSEPGVRRTIGEPRLGIGIRDVRGLVGTPVLKVNGRPLPLSQGFGYRSQSGLQSTLPAPRVGDTLDVEVLFEGTLQGTQLLSIVPLAGRTTVQVGSAWPHPQFSGDFLPRTRSIGKNGFQARWEVSSLATDAQAQFTEVEPKTDDAIDTISVALVDPVNLYSMVDRATKYALLFVLLTFVAFFMFEFLKALRIHPIQYGLVGLAIAIFFLLLLALSEHVAFGVAYVAAAIACVSLIGHYLASVLGGWRRGLGFASMLGALYAALYALLISEDNAMLLGAGLLFVVLAAVMVLTRKVDWYRGETVPSSSVGD